MLLDIFTLSMYVYTLTLTNKLACSHLNLEMWIQIKYIIYIHKVTFFLVSPLIIQEKSIVNSTKITLKPISQNIAQEGGGVGGYYGFTSSQCAGSFVRPWAGWVWRRCILVTGDLYQGCTNTCTYKSPLPQRASDALWC